jgi:hypothetical protein
MVGSDSVSCAQNCFKKSFVPVTKVLYRVQNFCTLYKSFVPGTEVLYRVQKFCTGYRSFVQGTEVLYSVQKFCTRYKILSFVQSRLSPLFLLSYFLICRGGDQGAILSCETRQSDRMTTMTQNGSVLKKNSGDSGVPLSKTFYWVSQDTQFQAKPP